MMSLSGSYLVRAIRPAFQDAHRVLPRSSDRAELRRHALKLRFWPGNTAEVGGTVLDLNWDWIRAASNLRIGELRVQDTIGNCDNLRIIFYLGDAKFREPLPRIWVLAVLQKKRQDFTTANIATFKARRLLVVERFEQSQH